MSPHPHASMLRQRSAHLVDLAERLELSAVMVLADAPTELAGRLLDRNRHQLHVAAEELRDAAYDCRRRADEIELAAAVAS